MAEPAEALRRNGLGLGATDLGQQVVRYSLELVNSGAELTPLLLAKNAVGCTMYQEDLLLL